MLDQFNASMLKERKKEPKLLNGNFRDSVIYGMQYN